MAIATNCVTYYRDDRFTNQDQADQTEATAYASALSQHGPAVKRYCLAITGHREDAEDLAQETWLRAYVAAHQSGIPLVIPYLLRIARNTWLDHQRREKSNARFLEQADLPFVNTIDPLELRDAVQVVAGHLPKTQQLIFLLRDVFQYTAAEIAEAVGTSEGAVKAALHRARATLARFRQTDLSIGQVEVLAQDDESVVEAYLASVQAGNPHRLLGELRLTYLNDRSAHTKRSSMPIQTRIFSGSTCTRMAA
jgi:RNA polymerase sigma factor (sigma-70 family)